MHGFELLSSVSHQKLAKVLARREVLTGASARTKLSRLAMANFRQLATASTVAKLLAAPVDIFAKGGHMRRHP